jgi:hypothetical protein
MYTGRGQASLGRWLCLLALYNIELMYVRNNNGVGSLFTKPTRITITAMKSKPTKMSTAWRANHAAVFLARDAAGEASSRSLGRSGARSGSAWSCSLADWSVISSSTYQVNGDVCSDAANRTAWCYRAVGWNVSAETTSVRVQVLNLVFDSDEASTMELSIPTCEMFPEGGEGS